MTSEIANLQKTKQELIARLWGSYLTFCKTFFPIVTGNEFVISSPQGRESHYITIARALTETFNLEHPRLYIGVPPGHGKSMLLSMWTAWALSRYPDAKFMYISYSFELAANHTEFIRRIMQTSHYKSLFNVHIRGDIKAKDYFMTTAGGAVKAFGTGGSITGYDAGRPFLDRFSGAIIIDDPHKADDVHSDTMRQDVIDKYDNTISIRPRSPNVPIIFIGQRLHEDDLAAHVLGGKDTQTWDSVILKSIDEAGNALHPAVNSLEYLHEVQRIKPYVFASQYQQDPMPAGGALFKREYFPILLTDPKMLATFITCDTAETSKSYNDATVFSFWGVYKIEHNGVEIEQYGLHWIDCYECRIEPKDLEEEFHVFYTDCLRYPVKPLLAAIEKKSTGVTLCSVLKDIRGLQIRDIKRSKESGSKTVRFLEMQPIMAAKLVSFTGGARHVDNCITHMMKITANNSHRHDDIADTAYDAIRLALIDKNPVVIRQEEVAQSIIADKLMQDMNKLNNARQQLWR